MCFHAPTRQKLNTDKNRKQGATNSCNMELDETRYALQHHWPVKRSLNHGESLGLWPVRCGTPFNPTKHYNCRRRHFGGAAKQTLAAVAGYSSLLYFKTPLPTFLTEETQVCQLAAIVLRNTERSLIVLKDNLRYQRERLGILEPARLS